MDRERIVSLLARKMTDDIFDDGHGVDSGEAWWWIYNAMINGVGNTLNSMTEKELNDKLEDLITEEEV